MPAIIFSLISYFSWGSGVFTEAIVARRMNAPSLVFWGAVITLILGAFLIPFQMQYLQGYTLGLLLFNLALGVGALFSGTLVYYEALRVGNRVLVGTIASSFPFVTVLASFLLLGERISSTQFWAMSVIFIGLFLSILNFKTIGKIAHWDKGVMLATATMVSWGLYFALLKILIDKVGWFWPNYIAFAFFPVLILYMRMRKIPFEPLTKKGVAGFLLLATILVRLAEFAYSLGISHGQVAIVAPIAGSNPTLFVLLAFLIFKDPITRQQIAGIITTLIGIVLLSIFSV